MEDKHTLAEQTADQLITYIIEHGLKEGQRLPSENSLCELLQVSRTTLREAIRMLSSRNILESRRGAGIFLSKNTGISDDPLGLTFIKDKDRVVTDLLELRMLLEPRIAARAAQNATSEQAEELAALAAAVEECYAKGIPHAAEDSAFHGKLGEISGNVIFPNLAPIIFRAIEMFIDMTSSRLKDETISTHRAIVEAVRNNDPTGAEDAMRLHLVYNRIRLNDNISYILDPEEEPSDSTHSE